MTDIICCCVACCSFAAVVVKSCVESSRWRGSVDAKLDTICARLKRLEA
jgi:hypothetical protein